MIRIYRSISHVHRIQNFGHALGLFVFAASSPNTTAVPLEKAAPEGCGRVLEQHSLLPTLQLTYHPPPPMYVLKYFKRMSRAYWILAMVRNARWQFLILETEVLVILLLPYSGMHAAQMTSSTFEALQACSFFSF